MNTKQKAEAWLTKPMMTNTEAEAEEIITALLKEREALLGAAKAVDQLDNDDFPFGDAFSERATTAFCGLSKAIAMCEEAK